MAKVYLETTDTEFGIIDNRVTVYGANGTQKVSINAGVTGVIVDQNVESVSFLGNTSDYLFKQSTNKVMVYATDGTTLLATIPTQGDTDGTLLNFANGTIGAKLSGSSMNVGGAIVNSVISALSPTTIDTATKSSATLFTGLLATGSTGVTPTPTTSTINVSSTSTTATLTSAADTIVFAAGNYDVTLSGFAVGDKIDLPATFLTTLNLSNTSATDGTIVLQSDDGTNVINITLTGISNANDLSTYSIDAFKSVFGATSLF